MPSTPPRSTSNSSGVLFNSFERLPKLANVPKEQVSDGLRPLSSVTAKRRWRPIEHDGTGGKYCQMVLDSGACCAAMPARIGEGYPLTIDNHAGAEYGGAMEGMTAKDEGSRVINVLNSKWTRMPMRHRVVENMKQPLVSAGETVSYGNLVLMSPSASFVAPISSEFEWHLNETVWKLAAKHGTQQNLPLYRNASGVYVFDAWVQEPKAMHSIGRKPVTGQAASSPSPSTPRRVAEAQQVPKEKKKVF